MLSVCTVSECFILILHVISMNYSNSYDEGKRTDLGTMKWKTCWWVIRSLFNPFGFQTTHITRNNAICVSFWWRDDADRDLFQSCFLS